MTKTCLVCLNSYNKKESRSFHMFPKNIILRKKWFEVLQITDQTLSIHSFVCSDHFRLEDIYVAPTGKRFFKKCAIPSIFTKRPVSAALSYEGASTSSASFQIAAYTDKGSTDSGESKDIGTSATETASEVMDLEQSPPRKKSTDSAELRDIGTSATETASEVMDLEQSPRKKRRLHFYGDIHSSDFDNPRKSKRNWGIIKATVSKQKKKIINLQQCRRRLKQRISCLNSLLKYLRQNKSRKWHFTG